jgi:hypothetical protein
MKKIILLVVLVVFTFSGVLAQRKRVGFGEALKRKWVSFVAKAESRGQKNLKMRVRNLTRDSLDLVFENGRMFVANGNYQPFVVTRSVTLAMHGSESKETYLKGFCGNASVPGVPLSADLDYTTRMGSEEMVQVLTQLQAMKLDDCRQMQSLVWHFTNQHGLERVYVDDERSKAFMHVVAQTLNTKIPDYSIQYEEPSELSSFMFTGVAQSMTAKLDYQLPETKSLDIVLLDDKGNVVKCFKHLDNLPQGRYQTAVNADIVGLSQGKYALAIVDEHKNRYFEQEVQI